MIRLAARRRHEGDAGILHTALPNDVFLQLEIFRVAIKPAAADGNDLPGFFRHGRFLRGRFTLWRLGRRAAAGVEPIGQMAQLVGDRRLILRFEKEREKTRLLRQRIHLLGQNQTSRIALSYYFSKICSSASSAAACPSAAAQRFNQKYFRHHYSIPKPPESMNLSLAFAAHVRQRSTPCRYVPASDLSATLLGGVNILCRCNCRRPKYRRRR
jgi:hypothetical protein